MLPYAGFHPGLHCLPKYKSRMKTVKREMAYSKIVVFVVGVKMITLLALANIIKEDQVTLLDADIDVYEIIKEQWQIQTGFRRFT